MLAIFFKSSETVFIKKVILTLVLNRLGGK